jgi:hypothetical protein
LPRRASYVTFSKTKKTKQPFVPPAVTGYQGADGHVAEMVHYKSLALGTSAASFGSDSLHQAEIKNVFLFCF